MLGSTRCALWLFDDAGETATLKAWYNLETSGRQINTTFEVAYYPIMQQMLTLNWPLLINKLAAFLQEVAWPDKSESLVIPLCYKEKNIGFIVTDNTEKREAFLQDRLTLAMNAANQVVLSIRGVQLFAENARLYHKATQRLSDLTVLYDAGQAFISTLDLDKILGIVMERTCAALSAEYGYALLTNDAQTEITFVATVGPNAQILKGHTIPAVGSVMGTVVRQGKALLINDTAALPEFLGEIDDYVNAVTKSLMVAPLKTKRGVLGALIVTNKQSGEFNKNNLNLLTSLSQLASGAIENARLFRQVQKYSQDLEEAVSARTVHLTAVNETGRAISSIVPMDELFARVTRFISELFNQARVSVGLRTGNYITFQKIYDGEFEPGTVPANHRLKISKYHILGQVILTGGADLIETISTAQLYKLKDESERPSTALVVPLTIGGKTIGIIVVQSRSWLASQQQDLGTLQSLAYQVAVAMENSRLLQKSREMATIRERTRLARDMHDGIAQNLAYLLLQVDRCLVMAEVKNPKLEDELENISQVISQNIEELRRHIFDLRPVGLEGHSIYKVLKQMTGDFGDKLGLETSCEIIGDEIELPFDVEASLYRIFQEALSNIRRYAQCKHVWISLKTRADKSVELTIKDDGKGFDPAQLPQMPFQFHGLGLVSMRERVRSLGGTLVVDTAPGQGTCIRVNVPNL
jgi:signal transduction histidine kinase